MTDSKKRTPRETQTREKTARRKPWAPPSTLDAPPAPHGYVHRWVRTAIRGDDDQNNVYSRMREGWEPVRADEYPEQSFQLFKTENMLVLLGVVDLCSAVSHKKRLMNELSIIGTRPAIK